MLSIKERFDRWQGGKAQLMKKNIDTALLYLPYMEGKESIDALKLDLIKESRQYQKLNSYNKREGGAYLYCKLKLEQSLEQLANKDTNEEKELIALNNVLEEVFNNPYSDPKQQLEKSIKKIKCILAMDLEEISDKKLVRDSLTDLYMAMHQTLKMLQNINTFLKWLIEKYLDLNELEQMIIHLMPVLESKIRNIEDFLAPKDNLSEVEDNSEKSGSAKGFTLIKPYFQQEFSILHKPSSLKKTFFKAMNSRLFMLKQDLNELIQYETKKEYLAENSNRIQNLIEAINQEKLHNQQSLFKLIHSHSPAFYFLMEHISEQEKNGFTEQMNALKPPGMLKNWLEQWTPTWLQHSLSLDLGGAEKGCYLHLKDLAEKYLYQMNLESEAIEQQRFFYQQKLFPQEEIEAMTKDTLNVLIKAVETAEKTVQEFQITSDFLYGAIWHIHLSDQSTTILDNFINTNNTFWTKLLSFLAQLFDVFKTDKIVTINQAREIKKQLFFWKFEYQRELEKELNLILTNPDIDLELKKQLQKQVKEELNSEIKILPGSFKKQKEISSLITNIEKLYANKKRVSRADDPALSMDIKNSFAVRT